MYSTDRSGSGDYEYIYLPSYAVFLRTRLLDLRGRWLVSLDVESASGGDFDEARSNEKKKVKGSMT